MKRTREEFIAGKEMNYRSMDERVLTARVYRSRLGLKNLLIWDAVTQETVFNGWVDAGQAYDQITSSFKNDDPQQRPVEGG